MAGRYLALVALATIGACAGRPAPAGDVPAAEAPPPPPPSHPRYPPPRPVRHPVRTGIDVLAAEGPGPLAGLRVGLITNHTGLDRTGRSTIDILAALPGVELVALFGPEHGLRGAADAGEHVADGRDDRTGLPIHSLLDDTKAPTAEEMAQLDVLVFDMQDVGARYYSYPWTMVFAMQAAAGAGVRFVVLDRPNPVTGSAVQGNVAVGPPSLMGVFPVAMRHGLTLGELAQFANQRLGIGVWLDVVPMTGWRRDMWYDETGLPWIAPSPNMPSLESALHYPGTCLFEMTSLAVGRGGPTPFQQIGAPWLDHVQLAARLNARGLPGVRFEPTTFPAVNPERQSHLGEQDPGERRGVRFIASDRDAYDPVHAAIVALVEIRRMHPDRLAFSANFDLLAGSTSLREQVQAGASAQQIMADWERQRTAFERERARYLLY